MLNLKNFTKHLILTVAALSCFAFQPETANAGGIKFHKGYVPIPRMHIDFCRNPAICIHVDCIGCRSCDYGEYPYHYRHHNPPPRYHRYPAPPPRYRHPAPPPAKTHKPVHHPGPNSHKPAPRPGSHPGKPAPRPGSHKH